MKAAILEKYDKKNIDIKVSEIPIPEINDDEILVKIKYAGVNPLDNMIIHGEVKLITPYKVPLVMGNEFSGVVEKTGKNVKNFEIGKREREFMVECHWIKLEHLQSTHLLIKMH